MENLSVRKYILYKLDRNLAILGIIAIGIFAIITETTDSPIVMAAVGGLTAYIGSRSGGSKEK